MNNKINQNKISNTQFNGIKPKVGEVQTVEKFIKEIVTDTVERAERYVADYGSFTFPTKKFKNPDTNLVVDEFWLGIEQPPRGIENFQKNRGVKLFASKNNKIVEVLLEYGTKDEILAKIKSEDFAKKIEEQTKNLSYHLEDL